MNKSFLIQQLSSLAVALVISFFIRLCYRWKTVGVGRRYSTFWPRFWTGFVDASILWPVGLFASAYLVVDVPKIVAAALVIVGNLAWLFYTVLLHARYGQTIGKMVTKVRVVDFRTEGKISWLQAWVREGIPLVLSLGLLGYDVFQIVTGHVTPKAYANGEAYNNNGPS